MMLMKEFEDKAEMLSKKGSHQCSIKTERATAAFARGEKLAFSILSYADDMITVSLSNPSMSVHKVDSGSCVSPVPVDVKNGSALAALTTLSTCTCNHSPAPSTSKFPRVVFVGSDKKDTNFSCMNHSMDRSSIPCLQSRSSSFSSSTEVESDTDDTHSLSSSTSRSSKSTSSVLSSQSSSSESLLSSTDESLGTSFNSSTSTDFSAKSIKLRRRFRNRATSLRRISSGNMKYFSYLAKQEETVKANAWRVLARKRRLSLLRKASKSNEYSSMSQAADIVQREHDIADSTYNAESLRNSRTASLPCLCPNSMATDSVATSEIDTIDDMHSGQANEEVSLSIRSLLPLTQPDNIRRLILFEWYHSLPSLCAIVLWCVAHESVYEVFHCINIQWLPDTNKSDVYTLLGGAFLCRMSGGLFEWLHDDNFNGAKFDLHNKLRLGDVDAKLLQWMRKRPKLREFTYVLGLYNCFVAVNNILDEIQPPEQGNDVFALQGMLITTRTVACRAIFAFVNAGISIYLLSRLGVGFSQT